MSSPSPSSCPSRHRRRWRLSVLVFIAAAGLAAGCDPTERHAASPSGIVLAIGDGMGVTQVTFTRNLLYEPGQRLSFESLPVTALMSTFSGSNPVTDSAAAATALAAGIKTDNSFVGWDLERREVTTIADLAQQAGWRVGYVTTSRITHATPAGFFAHAVRWDEATIALQLLEHAPDVALGGGLGFFLPASEAGQRRDDRNLVEEARAAGYTVWQRGADLSQVPDGKLLGLFAHDHLSYVLDDAQYPPERRDPTLEAMTRLALRMLSRDDRPFFLMIEGARIDHAAHSFDAAGVAHETRAFDQAVAAVMEFQRAHPGVLLLVTADHATGGMDINDYSDWSEVLLQQATVDELAAQVRNAGAGADMVAAATGHPDITEAELDVVRQEPNSYEASRHLGRILARRQGVTWMPQVNELDTKGHTGEDVPLYAGGPGAERFQGVLDNADVPKILVELTGWKGLGVKGE
jgi:alkaline phosphatase